PHVNNETGEVIDFDKEAEKYKAGNRKEAKVVAFWPDFLSKDIFVVCVFMVGFFFLVCFHYDFAMDPINFDPADSLKTPPHIYPEWYFLWSYEVLRGFFFSSDLGLMAFGVANVIFLLMPLLDRSKVVAPAHKRPAFFLWFWLLVADLIVLTIYGKLPPTGVNAYIGFVASITFLGLFVLLPIITAFEKEKAGGHS
ncbi:MAG: cytochrome bc complex cytochrome b subunit, partial [Helicobacter sp.]|nr:cytochrome bc complex cytochrome b subunit [Helicobacter sp.]